MSTGTNNLPRPYGLLAEITHRCPLHCPYCSNPTHYAPTTDELSTDEWARVLSDAANLGVLHAGFSGGEPLQRADLHELVRQARQAGLFTNLITSAVGLTRRRADELKHAGLDSIQISFQSDEESLADRIAGASAHQTKLEATRTVHEAGIPLSLNIVIHRDNIDRIAQLIELAERVGASRLELANAQYYGWAFNNLSALLPSRDQLAHAEKVYQSAKARLSGKMEILYVLPDYYGDRPKPCMNGWGRRYITVNPIGKVLPCPTAGEIPGMKFDSVRERSLAWIWKESEAFNRFRGTEWMPEPCKSCEFREQDFGGCRCQAALLTGDATVTDPACLLSPYRSALEKLVSNSSSAAKELIYRANPA